MEAVADGPARVDCRGDAHPDRQRFEPALGSAPLPADKSAAKELEARIDGLAAKPVSGKARAAIEPAVSGRTFAFEPNDAIGALPKEQRAVVETQVFSG